jgi:hypothetical protein
MMKNGGEMPYFSGGKRCMRRDAISFEVRK